MKKLLILTTTALLLFAFAFTAYAETKLDISGQVRSRSEASKKSFDEANEHISSAEYLRTRINIAANVAENADAFVQFQDSRMYGPLGQSGGLNSTSNVDVHQAYIKYNYWTKENWSIGTKAGRFEYVWGNQRLLGSVGWHNTGRSWEGALSWYDNKSFSITVGAFKKLEHTDSGYDADFDVFTTAAKFKKINLELLVLIEDDKDTTGMASDIQLMERATFAAYYTRKMDNIDMAFNFAIQGGTMADTYEDFDPATDTITTETDIAAIMFTGEVGYSFEGDKKARVAIGVDYASGDDGDDPTETKRFNNLYWTGHKFNGYMDYFAKDGGPNGLMDISLRGKMNITDGWTAGADIHLFSAAEEYTFIDQSGAVEDTVSTKDVGTEIDIFVKTSRVKGVALQMGVSLFSAKDNFAVYKEEPIYDSAPDAIAFKKQAAVWSYFQATMNF